MGTQARKTRLWVCDGERSWRGPEDVPWARRGRHSLTGDTDCVHHRVYCHETRGIVGPTTAMTLSRCPAPAAPRHSACGSLTQGLLGRFWGLALGGGNSIGQLSAYPSPTDTGIGRMGVQPLALRRLCSLCTPAQWAPNTRPEDSPTPESWPSAPAALPAGPGQRGLTAGSAVKCNTQAGSQAGGLDANSSSDAGGGHCRGDRAG